MPRVYRARAEEKRRVREPSATGAVWAGAAAALAVVAAANRDLPHRRGAGLAEERQRLCGDGAPVNRVGLTIEQVQAQPALQDGRTALVVSDVLRNIRPEPVRPQPLKVTLLDKDGERLKWMTVRGGQASAPPGSTRPFTLTLLNACGCHGRGVTFALDAPAKRTTKSLTQTFHRRYAEVAPSERSGRGGGSRAAAPADSPYALQSGESP